ncbi:MAG: hypothetical protein QXL16_01840 [Candidatus Micrarchaeaceae archaeon]
MKVLYAILATVVLANVSFAQTIENAISLTNIQMPSKIYAGENFTIYFQIYNSYSGTLNNLNFYYYTNSPIQVSPVSYALPYNIGAGLVGAYGVDEFSINVKVPSTLPQGEYAVYAQATYDTQVSSGFTSTYETGESVFPIYFYVYSNASLAASASVEGNPIPGSIANAELSINPVNGNLYNLSISLNASPMRIVGSSNLTIGNLYQAYSLPISLYLPYNITSGEYQINITAHYKTSSGSVKTQNLKVPFNLEINPPQIEIATLGSEPAELYPGYNSSILISVENSGLGPAKNVSIYIPNSNLKLKNSLGRLFIGYIPPQGSVQTSLLVQAPQRFSGTLNLPVEVSYYSADMEKFSYNISIPVALENSSIFNITGSSALLLPGAAYSPVTVFIKNIGNEPAEGISLSLQTIYPITPQDGNAYVSYLAPNSTANVTFFVSVDKLATPGSYPITVFEEWKQPNGAENQMFQGSETYYLSVSASKQNTNYSSAVAILVVILAIILFAFYRKRRSSRKR